MARTDKVISRTAAHVLCLLFQIEVVRRIVEMWRTGSRKETYDSRG